MAMRVMAGLSSAALAAVLECATMIMSTATPPTVTTMLTRLSRRPSPVTRFLQAADAMTIVPTATGANLVTAQRRLSTPMAMTVVEQAEGHGVRRAGRLAAPK